MIEKIIIQHRAKDGHWTDEQVFSNALDAYAVISKWGVLWPGSTHRVISRCIFFPAYTETVLSMHKGRRPKR